jgi:hypothetical protein
VLEKKVEIFYVYLLLFIKLVVETFKGNNITQEGIYSLHNFVTDNFKEYDLDTEYCLNIYKYFVYESRDMSGGRFKRCLYHF